MVMTLSPEETVAYREAQAALDALPPSVIHTTQFWLTSLAEDWRGEIPVRLHAGQKGGIGFAPPFSPEFIGYIGDLKCNKPGCGECSRAAGRAAHRNGEGRLRATKAFRKVREVAPREFDALYMYCVNRFTIPEIARSLSERAERLAKPERYHRPQVTLLLISGTDKVVRWW